MGFIWPTQFLNFLWVWWCWPSFFVLFFSFWLFILVSTSIVLFIFKHLFLWLHQVLAVAWEVEFPAQGSNPGPLHWEHAVLTSGPPGNSLLLFLANTTAGVLCPALDFRGLPHINCSKTSRSSSEMPSLHSYIINLASRTPCLLLSWTIFCV